MGYMHDGAPAHFSRAVRDVLSNTHHDRWIGRGGPTAWPPHSTPDLNPLDPLHAASCFQWLAHSKGSKRVFPPSPEEGNRSSFRNAVFSSMF
jgi:hypothetical protein